MTNTNKIISYVTMRYQSSFYIKDRILVNETKAGILRRPSGIKKNLSTWIYSEDDRECNDCW